MPIVTPLYAGLIALIYLALSARVILHRTGAGIALGDGGDAEMLRRIRAQANCGEYAPFALLLLLMAELQGAPLWMLHALGLMLLAGRTLHAWAFSRETRASPGRVAGTALTLSMIALAALATLGFALA